MQLPFVIRQLHEALATHAMAYRKEEGLRVSLQFSLKRESVALFRPILAQSGHPLRQPEVAPAKSASGGVGGGGAKRVPHGK